MLLRFLLVSVAASLGMDAPTTTQMNCWTCQARTWWDVHASAVTTPADLAPPAANLVVVAPQEPAATVAEAVAPMPDGSAAFVAESAAPAVVAEAVAPMPDGSAAFVAETVVPTQEVVPAVVAEAVAPMPDDSAAFVAEAAAAVAEGTFAPTAETIAAFVSGPVELMPDGLDAFVAEPAATDDAEQQALASAEELLRADGEVPSFDALVEALTADPSVGLYPALALESPIAEPESRIEILDEQPEVVESPAPAPAKDAKLAEAVRLTRQALHAWAGVLNAPAVVSAGR